MSAWMKTAPVVAGGVGGSGTRVIAAVLKDIGYYIGSDLNEALDNLWFTLLLKRTRWFYRQKHEPADMNQGLSLFEKIMKNQQGITSAEYRFLMSALWEIMLHGHDHLGSGRGMWALNRCRTMLRASRQAGASYIGWGWKEPNTHIFLESLNRHFPGMKYVFVIRHGLDMALNRNQAQLYNWGKLMDVEKPSSAQAVPVLSLEYWIKANQRAMSLGRKLLQDRFYVINFNELQKNPGEEVEKFLNFIQYDIPNSGFLHELCDKITRPQTPPRYQNFDLSCFSADQLDEVRKLGFSV